MKLTALATALAAAVTVSVPGVAMAVDFSLYGAANLSMDFLNNGDKGDFYLSSNSSHLGVRGSQELGTERKLKGLLQIETQVDLANSATAFAANRESYLGVQGAFGIVLAGNLQGADQWVGEMNLFADQLGDIGNFAALGASRYADHAVLYKLPARDKLKLQVTYRAANGTGAGQDASLGVKASLAQGPLSASAGLFNINEGDLNVLFLVGGMDLGGGMNAKGGLVYGDGSKSTGDVNATVVTAGLSLKNGPGVAKAQLAFASASSSQGGFMLAGGYDYPYDRNVLLYATAALVSNDTNATWTASGYGHGANQAVAAAGKDPVGVSVGVSIGF